ncbi:hypothetical protein ACWCV9_33320, partial [Streptomyces sp. NPDC001606]
MRSTVGRVGTIASSQATTRPSCYDALCQPTFQFRRVQPDRGTGQAAALLTRVAERQPASGAAGPGDSGGGGSGVLSGAAGVSAARGVSASGQPGAAPLVVDGRVRVDAVLTETPDSDAAKRTVQRLRERLHGSIRGPSSAVTPPSSTTPSAPPHTTLLLWSTWCLWESGALRAAKRRPETASGTAP